MAGFPEPLAGLAIAIGFVGIGLAEVRNSAFERVGELFDVGMIERSRLVSVEPAARAAEPAVSAGVNEFVEMTAEPAIGEIDVVLDDPARILE